MHDSDSSASRHASRWHRQRAPELPSACRRRTCPAAAGCVDGRRSPFQSAVPSEYASATERSHGHWLVVTTVAGESTRSPGVSRRHRVGSSQTAEESNLTLGVTSLKTVEHTNTHILTAIYWSLILQTPPRKPMETAGI